MRAWADALALSVVQVLQYLRKRLSADETRAEQRKVVDGMVKASIERRSTTGVGFEETGSTAKPSDGEVRVAYSFLDSCSS